MLPNIYEEELTEDFEIEEEASRTYRLRFDGQPGNGMIDGVEAMKQAIFLILHTERYEHEIFSWDYGIELMELIGSDAPELLEGDLEEAISEALLADDRIQGVTDFTFTPTEGKRGLLVQFTVETDVGDIVSELEWNNTLEVTA